MHGNCVRRVGLFAITGFVALGALVPTPTFASHDDLSVARFALSRVEERIERVRERIEERRARIEERLEQRQERLCERLERLRERTGGFKPLPSFCKGGDEGGEDDREPDVILSAQPMSVVLGATSTLVWESERAEVCVASGGWDGAKVFDGSEQVAPTATTEYTLSCGNKNGTTTREVTVTVTAPLSAPSVELVAGDTTLTEGDTTTLSWTTMNAEVCIAYVGWSGARATTGAELVGPNVTTTYELSCGNSTGTTSDSMTVEVTPVHPPEPAPTVDLSAESALVGTGATTTLTWESMYASVCTASGAGGFSGTVATSGSVVVTVNATTTYEIACNNGEGTTTDSVTVDAYTPATPPVGKVLVSEVVFNPSGSEPANEWVELYNGTGADVNLEGWTIGDASSTDVLATTTRVFSAGTFVIVTSSTTLGASLGLPVDAVVVLPTSIGHNGLGNTGDRVRLINASAVEVDAMSWGSDTYAFSPSVGIGGMTEDDSIARKVLSVDTDTEGDWEQVTSPTPGSGPNEVN